MYLGRLIAIKSQFILLALSFFFSFITILIYKAVVRKDFSKSLRQYARLLYFLIGPLGYFVYSVSLNQSSRYFNGISETTILNYTWPVFTIIFTNLLTRKRSDSLWYRVVEICGVTVGFLAVINLAVKGDYASFNINVPGIAWGLVGGAAYGVYSTYSGTLKSNEQFDFLIVSTFSSLVLAALFSVVELDIIPTLTWADVWVVFLSGSLLSGFGYITWTSANRLAREKQVNISSVASMMFVLPVISLVIVSLLLQEKLLTQPYFMGSLGLIVLSSILCQKTEWLALKLQRMLHQ